MRALRTGLTASVLLVVAGLQLVTETIANEPPDIVNGSTIPRRPKANPFRLNRLPGRGVGVVRQMVRCVGHQAESALDRAAEEIPAAIVISSAHAPSCLWPQAY